eukprot:TRINITY_DN194_c0_g1_i2.p1 TRINITY_DN194_c0_g1~~TRINITY_DN194_c0_g1_i2.p1  ORF type:complete len:376 (-),score=86.57 TRINITY_DN194_c0_g1_i2:34-1089(-)
MIADAKRVLGPVTSIASPLKLPEFRVGTLDSLMSLADELVKVDALAESTVKRIAKGMYEINMFDEVGLVEYISNFEWKETRFPIRMSTVKLTDTVAALQKEMFMIDEELKTKTQQFTEARNAHAAMTRKENGNLLVKSLVGLVKPGDLTFTENLCTLLVAVSVYASKDWAASYERLTQFVVPRSSKLIAADSEFELYSVVVFRRVADEFKTAAREKRFTVREFDPDTVVGAAVGSQSKQQVEEQFDAMKASMAKWSTTNFSEALSLWMHLKVVRIFVEAVLRYGLPANFTALVIKPKTQKHDRLVKNALYDLYGKLSGHGYSSGNADLEDASNEFHPYVFLTLDTETGHKQ